MRYLLLVPILLLGGCLFHSRGVPAAPDALSCAQRTLSGLGYAILTSPQPLETGTLTAERELPRTGIYPVLAQVTVSVRGESGERRIEVDGRRYEEFAPRDRSPEVSPGAVRVGTSARGRRSLPAGPVAEDVEAVRAMCGSAAPRMAEQGS